MVILNRWLGGIWVLFWLYWLVSAVGAKKTVSLNMRKFAGIRLGIFILALALIRLSTVRGHLLSSIYLAQSNEILMGAGFILFLAGLLLAIWARLHLGKNWGMPMSLKQDPELVTSGPYRSIRHPIYSGILLAVLGSALMSGLYWLIILIVVGVYFVYSAYEEEKIMLQQFPKTYPDYKEKTKMLIPFIL
jgi:protein-S-isoprenylcysteine O-methyltransferase Ste14